MKKFQNILVAFDLNKTLFFKSESPLPMRHHSKIKRYFFYLRPHIKELVEYLHMNQINYCFWSNMMGKNCVKYVDELKGVGMNRHCGIFDQDFCDWASQKIEATEATQQKQKVQSIKNLNKLAALFKIDVDNCILVDDSKQKNVEGCHLIHIDSFTGQQIDKQLLMVIDRLKQFRKSRINEQDNFFPMLKYTEYKYQAELDKIKPPKMTKPVEEKKPQPSEIELLIEKDPQLKKFKEDLTSEKERKRAIAKEIEVIEKATVEMAEEVKKKSEGKSIRKGDDLLVEVLTFAKNKKAAEKKLVQLKDNKKNCEEKINLIKKLMRAKVKELCPNLAHEQQETKDEVNQGSQVAKEKGKNKKKKKVQKIEGEGDKAKAEETKEKIETNEKIEKIEKIEKS